MRAHGVPNFPEPKISSNGNEHKVAIRVTPAITGNPQFKPAQQACSKLLPGGGPGGRLQSPDQPPRTVAVPEGRRMHPPARVPNFPDPTFSGGGVHLPKTAGIDPHSPQVRAAEEACQSLIPGGLHGDH